MKNDYFILKVNDSLETFLIFSNIPNFVVDAFVYNKALEIK